MPRLLTLLIALCVLCAPAFATQGSQRSFVALANAGNYARVLANAQITVCQYNVVAPNVCTSPVTIYQDPALTIPYTPAGRLRADANGNYSYYATAGNFWEQVCATGAQCRTQAITLSGDGVGCASDCVTAINNSAGSFSFGGPQVSCSGVNCLFSLPYDVTKYGAKMDGSDDSTPVRAAISAASAAGGGVVYIPVGTIVTQPIQGVSNVYFMGAGTALTTWKLINAASPVQPSGSNTCSSTASVLIECYTSGWVISDMTIDGNQSGQSATTSYGIYVSANGYTPTSKTPPRIERVTVQFTETDGIHVDFGSNGQGFHSHITVYGAGGIGIFAGSYDTQWTDLNIGQSGLQGLYIAVSAQHFIGVKSWFSGSVTPSSGTGILSVAGNVQCDSCEAQDNQFHGIYLDGATGNVFTGVVSTGNNRTSATSGNGVEIANGSGNIVIGNATGGADFAASQLYAVEFLGSSSNNHVRLTSSANVTGLIHGTFSNEDVLVVDAAGTNQSQLLGTNINTTGPIVSSAYIGSVSSSTTAFQGMRIGNGTNTWFPTVEGASGQFGIQDGSTGNNPFEIAMGAPSDSIKIQSSGQATINLANNSTAVTQTATDSSTKVATMAAVHGVVNAIAVPDMVWSSYTGSSTATSGNIQSVAWPPQGNINLTAFHATSVTAPTCTVQPIMSLKVAGAAVATFTIANSANSWTVASGTFPIAVTAAQAVQLSITTAGTCATQPSSPASLLDYQMQ